MKTKKPSKTTKRELLRIHVAACRQMNEDVEPKCEVCGKPYAIHKGIVGTCQQLQDALAQLKHIHALATVKFDEWSVKKRCVKLRQLMRDIAQLSRRDA